MAKSHLHQETVDGQTYWMPPDIPAGADHSPNLFLLPGFDEYMLGYKERSAILEPIHAQKIVPVNNGVFNPTLVIKGKVVGVWKRTFKKDTVAVTVSPFDPLSETYQPAIVAAVERYGKFVGKSAAVTSL